MEAFRRVVGASSAIADAPWFTSEWIAETVARAPERFDRAMERWRDLYRAATEQRDAARRVIDLPNRAAKERDEAAQREREAKREIDWLLNQGKSGTETDFYPYRYLANEGFLPGYNFPRLPLRALVSVRDDAHMVDRPRFLGLSEFGPWNVIYHEGRKHRVESCILPAGGIEPRLTHARICKMCGYIHPGDAAGVDLCEHCQTPLNGANSEYPHGLLDQPTVRTRRRDRISSDEEERAREGYVIRTHYRFSPTERERYAVVVSPEGEPLLEVRYAPQSELWRINNGWRRASRSDGFTIDAESGKWQRRDDDDHDTSPDPAGSEPRSGIRPYVTDSRNILLLRPNVETSEREAFLKTLAYALQRGVQFVYQVEEQEIAVELIGEDAHMRLLLWEAAEGGVGVWERILSEPDAVAKIAREALRVCHFDGETGEADAKWRDLCAVACYDCLLSYSNQGDHRHLDRHLVRDYLLSLAHGIVRQAGGERDYDAQYRWLFDRTDPGSSLEREFLDYLYRNNLRLPDYAQQLPDGNMLVRPDFYFERDGQPGIAVFVDGPKHDSDAQRKLDGDVRERLEDRGYKVVVVHHGREFAEQWADPVLYDEAKGLPAAPLPDAASVASSTRDDGGKGERVTETPISVARAAPPEKPHPVIAETKRRLRGLKPNTGDQKPTITGLSGPMAGGTVWMQVAPASLDRALRLADALLKAAEARGYTVTLDTAGEHAGIVVAGQFVPLQLHEGTRREPHIPAAAEEKRHKCAPWWHIPEWDYHPTGVLTFEIGHSYTSGRRRWSEGERWKQEDRIEAMAAAMHAAELERERRERERRERELEWLRREEERRQEEERRKHLGREMEAWQLARDIRAYVREMRDALNDTGAEPAADAKTSERLDWALRYADAIDPVVALHGKARVSPADAGDMPNHDLGFHLNAGK